MDPAQVFARRVLVVTLDAYRYSTRAKKAAHSYTSFAKTTFLGLSGAGRTGRWDHPCDIETDDGLRIRQVYVKRPLVQPRLRNHLRNLLLCYFPGVIRMALVILRSPADVVHVTGTPLTLLGLLHRARYGSMMVLDIQERPGLVSSRGSLTSYFSRFEKFIVRRAARFVTLATVVTHGDVDIVRQFGYQSVELVRNAPLKQWRAEYRPPIIDPDQPIEFIAIGSIFEGRGFETLLRGFATASTRSAIRLTICGPGRQDYLDGLRALTIQLGVGDLVTWMDPITSEDVSSLYLDHHIGLVLYDQSDPGNDGLSNKILECVASGRPVLAGNLPENRRFVLENSAGWLTEVTDADIAEALARPNLIDEVGILSGRCRGFGDTWLNWQAEFGKVLAKLHLEASTLSLVKSDQQAQRIRR